MIQHPVVVWDLEEELDIKEILLAFDTEANTATVTRTELDAPLIEEFVIEEDEIIVEDFRVVHVDVEIFAECVLEVGQ